MTEPASELEEEASLLRWAVRVLAGRVGIYPDRHTSIYEEVKAQGYGDTAAMEKAIRSAFIPPDDPAGPDTGPVGPHDVAVGPGPTGPTGVGEPELSRVKAELAALRTAAKRILDTSNTVGWNLAETDGYDQLASRAEAATQDRESFAQFQEAFDPKTCRELIGMIDARDRALQEAAAAIRILRAVSMPTVDDITWALNMGWNDFVSDAGVYPECLTVVDGGPGHFIRADFGLSNFAEMVRGWLTRKMTDR